MYLTYLLTEWGCLQPCRHRYNNAII